MEVKIAALADYVNITNEGKLNILGVFGNVMAENVPAVHAKMVLVAQIEFDATETGEKDMRVVLVDEDGGEVLSASGKVVIERMPDGRPSVFNQMLDLNNITFPKFGRYEFRILVGDVLACRVPFDVTKMMRAAAKN